MDIAQTTDIIARLRIVLGEDGVTTGSAVPERNRQDAIGKAPTVPRALVRPRTTEDVATVLSICNAAGQPVTIQGGLTGLAGGAHPFPAEIALSLERMRGVTIDPSSATATALAGTPLEVIQEAAAAEGFLCGIDLGARGTATIGGNVATNAGGNQVLRYGMARHNVLGLEVVRADGQIVRNLNTMLKNNAGYDWMQLFIGSEGTLGVVTRVVLRLHPAPGDRQTLLCGLDGMENAMALLRALEDRFGADLLVFEGMWREFMDAAIHKVGLKSPFAAPNGLPIHGLPIHDLPIHDLTILAEVATDEDALTETLAALVDDGRVSEVILARSGPDAARLWAYRESVYEYPGLQGRSAGFDISIPRPKISAAVEEFRAAAQRLWPGALSVVFGHIADSNLHIVVGAFDGGFDIKEADKAVVDDAVYSIVAHHAGSVSAEHGIGTLKKAYLPLSRTPEELDLMRTIKAALDPKGILNPGRIFDQSPAR